MYIAIGKSTSLGWIKGLSGIDKTYFMKKYWLRHVPEKIHFFVAACYAKNVLGKNIKVTTLVFPLNYKF